MIALKEACSVANVAWVQVLPYGRHETARGWFLLDEEGIRACIADFGSRANDMVIDYEHQTLEGVEAPAAGWIKRLFSMPPSPMRGEGEGAPGLWAEVQWTPRAEEYLRNREYRYLSPVFLRDRATGRVVRLINAALTNQPAIDGMEPVAAKDETIPAHGPGVGDNRKEVRMKKLFEMLGLGAGAAGAIDAAGRQAAAAVDTAAAAEGEAGLLERLREALELGAGAGEAEVMGALAALLQGSAQARGLAARVAELEACIKGLEAGGLVESAMKEGKIAPAQRGWALEYAGRDLRGFEAFVAKAPAVVPMGEAAAMAGRGGLAAIDALQAEVNRALNIDGTTFRKHN